MQFTRPTQEQYTAMLTDWRADKAVRDTLTAMDAAETARLAADVQNVASAILAGMTESDWYGQPDAFDYVAQCQSAFHPDACGDCPDAHSDV